jgi:hypothetical protein
MSSRRELMKAVAEHNGKDRNCAQDL